MNRWRHGGPPDGALGQETSPVALSARPRPTSSGRPVRPNQPRVPCPHIAALPAALLLAPLCAVAVLALAGCAQPSKAAPAANATSQCGRTRTAANVPVTIKVVRGRTSCATALAVERSYAKAILAGKAPGNGGGGPVHVSGWTCQGYPTPKVLKTGDASQCVNGSRKILAILPPPS
jgi:hypothetical protein